MSTSQRAAMLCDWGGKASMVRVWVADKTLDPQPTRVISERYGDEVLYHKVLYKLTLLYFTSFHFTEVTNISNFEVIVGLCGSMSSTDSLPVSRFFLFFIFLYVSRITQQVVNVFQKVSQC